MSAFWHKNRTAVPQARQIAENSIEMIALAVDHWQTKRRYREAVVAVHREERVFSPAFFNAVKPVFMINRAFDRGRRHRRTVIVLFAQRSFQSGPHEVNLPCADHDVTFGASGNKL